MSESLQDVCAPVLGKLGVLLDEIRSLLVVLDAQDEEKDAALVDETGTPASRLGALR